MAEQWIDWKPQPGDIKPERYRYWSDVINQWVTGRHPNEPVSKHDAAYTKYQIPAPVVTPSEDRPPWIDPQCKFRWGDRVKDKEGNVWFVNNPWDIPEGANSIFPVTCTKSLWDAPPHSCYLNLDCDYNIFEERQLELFPEDLPQHFDDRLLDADQPQEQPKTARVPREIWVNCGSTGGYGLAWDSQLKAERFADDDCETLHFREVL